MSLNSVHQSGKTSNLSLRYTSHTAFNVKSVRKEVEETIKKTDCGLVSKQRGLSDSIAVDDVSISTSPTNAMSAVSVTTVNSGGNSIAIPIQVVPDGLPSGMTMTATPSVPNSAPPPYY
ncbi:hypothetical protein K435DRAFT_865588 [Dendrothele bispora CBS 962.96]|uniref:Uncharacterized protein n=1 Tax=Dendrothele bispora (strain CBS 962.96) TaxID=1314807 RepID=A0A4S8LJ26_DENBC|nr:hypothetical protein K435DRAFT_865588 [Dendrothele bispora CBS 962.96]